MKNKKYYVVCTLVVLVAILSQSFKAMSPDPELKNIKAFPSTMTYKQVDHEMHKDNISETETVMITPRSEVFNFAVSPTKLLNR